MTLTKTISALTLASGLFTAANAEITGEFNAGTRALMNNPKFGNQAFADSRFRLNLDYSLGDKIRFGTSGFFDFSSKPGLDHNMGDGKETNIDKAFMTYIPNKNLEFTLGSFDNCFTSWTEPDIPVFGAKAKISNNDLYAKLVYNIGQKWLHQAKTGFYAAELGANIGSFSLNANYMHWINLDKNYIRTNSKKGDDYANKFHIANISAEYTKGPLTLSASGMHNFDAESLNNGIIIGLCLGQLEEKGDLCFAIYDVYIEADAAYAGFRPNKTPGPNVKASLFRGSYQITENGTLELTHGRPTRISGPLGGRKWKYYAIDFKQSF